ncbi:MAG: plasmid pRiA4b ORF-3 family protein, partial [Proteobacteria bacterium]|nr:plasmid pRiA4b ORF-3 family protein [Pseudomonadota bacterium]
KRACPPEDCGGIWGYAELLEIINNPEHEEYEEMMEWLGGEFDPEHFDMREVGFDNPDKRRKFAFG